MRGMSPRPWPCVRHTWGQAVLSARGEGGQGGQEEQAGAQTTRRMPSTREAPGFQANPPGPLAALSPRRTARRGTSWTPAGRVSQPAASGVGRARSLSHRAGNERGALALP
jgi:hypothetical protein